MASHSHSQSPMITLNDLFAVVEEEQRKILELLGGATMSFWQYNPIVMEYNQPFYPTRSHQAFRENHQQLALLW